LCLELMEAFFDDGRWTMDDTGSSSIVHHPLSVIDVGCGSGILSIAALKLGAARALGVDIDHESITNSRENARVNGIGEEFILGLGSVPEILAGGFPFKSAPLIVANILAPVINRLFEAGLAQLAEPGGTLILSGILADQAGTVAEAAQAKGMEPGERKQIGDWVALSYKRPG
jgi:ribosomal protein L11 methyltransferase